jgi:GT2 family glycosyltransferase
VKEAAQHLAWVGAFGVYSVAFESTRPMPTLSIFILCHNRPDDARRAIASVLAQTDRDFLLTVSDNSSNDEVQNMLAGHFPEVKCLRRAPALTALAHFNQCIDDVETDYFCLFHDDDLLEPNYVREMKLAISQHPQAIALGCNAHVETLGKREPHPSFRSHQKIEIIARAKDLATRYFSRSQSGIAPFPGYLYQKSAVAQQRFATDAGKYSDVTWLLRLAQQAPIVWVTQALMTYRMHEGNDGNTESRRDRLRFLAYLKRERLALGKGILQDYRCSFIYKPILKSPQAAHPTRWALAKAFVKRDRAMRWLRLSSYQAVARRALVKCMEKT